MHYILLWVFIAQIPDIYDCIKYDVEHNNAVLENTEAWKVAVDMYTHVKVSNRIQLLGGELSV